MTPEVEDSLLKEWYEAAAILPNPFGTLKGVEENDVRQLMRVVWVKALESGNPILSRRLRPNVECASWVVEEVKRLEAKAYLTGSLLLAMKEVLRISDRDHIAWNEAKDLIKQIEGGV